MNAAFPVANLLVIRSLDMDRAVTFYEQVGLWFRRHSHGNGPEHYVSELSGFVFEIYPRRNSKDSTAHTRLGFRVGDVDSVIERLREMGVTVVNEPAHTEWGRRGVVRDFDGHVVELLTPF